MEERKHAHCIQLSEKEELKKTLDKSKGEIIKIFEILCPTEVSLKRATKNTHDVFDNLFDKLMP